MSITVRSLLAKVKPYRDDLTEDQANYAIMEAVRKICRQTGYAKAVVNTISTIAGTPTININSAFSTYGSVYRIHLVRRYDTVMVSWKNLYEYSQQNVNNVVDYRDYSQGYPDGWAYTGNGVIQLYPTPDKIYTMEVTASFVPVGEFDAIPLPDEAEDCIVAGALATLLAIPGTLQNLQYSKDREILHTRELDFLKASALLGQSGRPRAWGGGFIQRMTGPYFWRW